MPLPPSEMQIMTGDEFPDGLVCVECGQEIQPGGFYCSVPEGMTDDGYPIEELVCVACS